MYGSGTKWIAYDDHTGFSREYVDWDSYNVPRRHEAMNTVADYERLVLRVL